MNSNECPLSAALKPLRGKWEPVIIKFLSINGDSGYNDIYNRMDNITPKALTGALKLLYDEGIINRVTVSEKPRRVVYSLTEKGVAMIKPLNTIESLNGDAKYSGAKSK
jgi:DNA-binding HxlR family transcriptional regulator